MRYLRRGAGRLKRGLCLLLTCVMLLGLFPAPSLAAFTPNSAIKLKSITWSSTQYQSAYFDRPCLIQDSHMEVGDLTLSGFCGDHSKHLNNNHLGDTWSNPQEVTNSVVKTLLAYYYTHLLGEDYYTDECISKGFNYQLDENNLLLVVGWIQEAVWMWSTGQLPSDHEGQVEMVAQAFREATNARLGTSYASIDDPTSPGSPNTFRNVTELVLSNPGAWCDCPVYEYFHPNTEDVQPILVGYPQKVPRQVLPGLYSVTVKKVDATNPSLTLPGATFRITSVTDMSFTPRTGVTGSSGTYTFDNLPAGTYGIMETAAPEGYAIDSAGPDYVTLPDDDAATITKVFTDTPTIVVSGSIRKVDADNPTRGLVGAVIAIQGVDNDFYGEFTTGSGGALEGLDWNSLVPGSYRAWEIGAPEGYSLDPSDVKTFRVSRETPEVRLVFQDDAKVRVQLQKLDDSDRPLPGAVFNILKDGQIIGTEATDASGKITVSDVETGMYVFVEVIWCEGCL